VNEERRAPVRRALMVDSERGWRGGQAQVFLLMRGLVEAGVEVHLAAPRAGALFDRAASLDVTRHAWDPRAGAGIGGLVALRSLMVRGHYDVVHSHASRAHSQAALARIGVRPRPAHIVSRRVDFAVGRGPLGAWKYRRGADAYIAISRGVSDVLQAGGVPAPRIYIAPSGIDLGKFEGVRDPAYLRAEFAITGNVKIVGNVAALVPHKSQADFLRAAARVRTLYRDVRFFLVGEGELRPGLEVLAGELGIGDAVVFTGFRPDVLELMSLFDVFVMSSYLEGLGTSIMDAQAMGVPVVATRAGGIPEIVRDGVTGLTVPPRDPGLLARAILRMLEDDELRAHCVHAARRAAEEYDFHRTVYKTLDVYRAVCPGDRSPGRNQAA
jgi:L-malate glycosyltransferase